MSGFHRPRNGYKSGNARAVIGNAGCGHAITVAMDFYICAGGKHGVQVRRKQNDLVFIRAAELPDDIANLIAVHREARFRQHFAQGCGSRFLLKRRRRNLR
jgi:hypothetical protein